MINAKKIYYVNLINEHKGDQKALYKIVDNLWKQRKETPLPPCSSFQSLADEFCEYFVHKVEKIRSGFDETSAAHSCNARVEVAHPFTDFEMLTHENVEKLVLCAPVKTCASDSLPTCIVKECISEIVPVFTHILNSSLQSGYFPNEFKRAIVVPLLKKVGLECCMKNYRPVSNLQFLSKVIERAVAAQLIAHLHKNGLEEQLQSAYKKFHSTETALLKVQNDLLMDMDENRVSLLVQLDLSAAFDTVDIVILIQILQNQFGVSGKVISWFCSYLSQAVSVNGNKPANYVLS